MVCVDMSHEVIVNICCVATISTFKFLFCLVICHAFCFNFLTFDKAWSVTTWQCRWDCWRCCGRWCSWCTQWTGLDEITIGIVRRWTLDGDWGDIWRFWDRFIGRCSWKRNRGGKLKIFHFYNMLLLNCIVTGSRLLELMASWSKVEEFGCWIWDSELLIM